MTRRQALIDLGSNTVKLAVYEIEGNGFSCIRYESRYGYIVQEVQEGLLTLDGLARLRAILGELGGIAAEYGCREADGTLRCFSTSSLRGVSNIQIVIEAIKNTTGIIIRPISGETEARCNLRAMRESTGEASFLGADLGGGSLQLFRCRDGRPDGMESLPLGALRLARMFAAGMLPTRAEAVRMRVYVRDQLAGGQVRPGPAGPGLLLSMGGTLRLVGALLGGPEFSAGQLRALLERYLDDPETARREICRVTPERLNSAVSGMICMDEVCRYFAVSRLRFLDCSVREGYLREFVMEGGA